VRFRTWPAAALGLSGLLVLVVVSLTTVSRRAQEIYTELDQLNAHHRVIEAKFRRLRSDIHLSSIFTRDYLLDTDRHAPEYRRRLDEFRSTNLATFAELRVLGARDGWDDDVRAERLQAELEDYWRATEPLFDLRPGEQLTESVAFLRSQVLPRREAVLALAREIEDLNNENLAVERAEVTRRQREFRSDLEILLWQSVLLGLVVAAAAVARLGVVERRSAAAERQMRELSQELVATQEEERKKLSRELHDHIGQVLTALRMELGRIDRLRVPTNAALAEAVSQTRPLLDEMVRSVRDLALGLRPSMLDDFGLQAALEWHVRDFTRRYGLHVELKFEGTFDGLPDPHRTCIYRTVQEALTNCAKHSRASRVDVALRETRDGLDVSISDDGIGILPAVRRTGLGLRGIEERVRDLKGTLTVCGGPGGGTALTVRLPHPPVRIEEPGARAAG
jgi:signal transduction histidine kinase